MAASKTQPLDLSVAEHLATVEPAGRRAEAERLDALFRASTGETGEVWTGGIVGYGRYDYKYASGHSGTWMRSGFAVRRTALTLYLMAGAARYDELLARLGPHKTGASCLYVKRLSDVDEAVLAELIRSSHAAVAVGDIDCGR